MRAAAVLRATHCRTCVRQIAASAQEQARRLRHVPASGRQQAGLPAARPSRSRRAGEEARSGQRGAARSAATSAAKAAPPSPLPGLGSAAAQHPQRARGHLRLDCKRDNLGQEKPMAIRRSKGGTLPAVLLAWCAGLSAFASSPTTQAANADFNGAWSVKWCDKTNPRLDCGGFNITLRQDGDRLCGDFGSALVNLRQVDEGSIVGTVVGNTAVLAVESMRNQSIALVRAERQGNTLHWKVVDEIRPGGADIDIIALNDRLTKDPKKSPAAKAGDASRGCGRGQPATTAGFAGRPPPPKAETHGESSARAPCPRHPAQCLNIKPRSYLRCRSCGSISAK